ncbi:A/G-specific adenine glycosylase [Pedobacter sp. UYP30]|uniref:A/G-specific adenine glycosylase n=1 Tax=Pedobacter sp. UYP30 TaxID=1756400 RepID=UPI0033987497
MDFQHTLLSWYKTHKRDLPWRHTNNPYIIWLSEIILQQTRVDQGTPYFLKFLDAFPTVTDFAKADEASILKLWQGLGYYSRARNMHATAKQVIGDYNGVFPTSYQELLKLRGIGPYSAAAISSFSAGAKQAVVDGNVFRVLARYFGIQSPINAPKGIKEFNVLAAELLFMPDPGLYNQAIMEFGALQCKAKKPGCSICPLNVDCVALKTDSVGKLPVKLPKAAKKSRYFNYFICIKNNQILVRHRLAGDIWQHLFDFPCIETKDAYDGLQPDLMDAAVAVFGVDSSLSLKTSLRHILTHQLITAKFFLVDDFFIELSKFDNCKWVSLQELDELPQPKLINNFIEKFL